MESRNLKTEIYEALFILQRMHDHIENWEVFPDDLKEQGRQTVRSLNQWTVEDKEITKYIFTIKDLLMLELRCNNELIKHQIKLVEADRQRILSHGVFAN